MKKSVFLISALPFVLVLALQSTATACPSCYGAADSPQTAGMNWAILSLLTVTGSVLVGMSAFFVYLRKKALDFNRRFNDKLN